jgi:NADH-quinone oxidoreductase subunit J
METPSIVQWALVAFTGLMAILVVAVRSPVVAAMCLMGTLFGTGALYFGLGFFFVGAVQILVYAGAISVLFVFVVMLLDLKPFPVRIPGSVVTKGFALVAGGALLVAMSTSVLPSLVTAAADASEAASAKSIALRFLSKYMLPFQVTGLLLLAAVVGVVVLGRPVKASKPEAVR